MFKKSLMGLGLLAVGSYLWMGTSVGSYVATGYHQTKAYFQGQVPIEFEIKRAKHLVDQLVPDIHKTKKAIAEDEVKIRRLESEVAKMDENLDSERSAILALKETLAKGLTSYRIGHQTVSHDALRGELNRRFNSYRRAEGVLEAKNQILVSQRNQLEATKDQYNNLIQSKQELETELATLEAKLKMVEAKKAENHLQIDDSELSRVRELINNINDRIEVEVKLSESDGKLIKQIRTEDIPPVDLESQIDTYFKAERQVGDKAI